VIHVLISVFTVATDGSTADTSLSNSELAAIVGGSVGGVLLIVLIVLVVLRHKKSRDPAPKPPKSAPAKVFRQCHLYVGRSLI
jgi:hypothetical protein